MQRVKNGRIATKAFALNRGRRRNFASVDCGGGGGRIGTRVSMKPRKSKSDVLRPSAAVE